MKVKFSHIVFLLLFITIMSTLIINCKNILNAQEVEQLTLVSSAVEKSKDNETIKKELEETTFFKTAVSSVTNSTKGKTDEPIVVAGGAIGVIDIESVGIRAQIFEGTDDETLKYYVGRFTTGVMPGETGNFALAAHNNIYTELFRNLHKVSIGDKVRIVTRTKEYIYQITSKNIINPTQVEVLKGSKKKEITLVTCTNMGRQRVIVKGELIDEKSI